MNMISMIRDSVEPGGRDRFECTEQAWKLLLEIGKRFGWKALGTTYVPVKDSTLSDTIVLHDYQPGERRDSKCVDDADAKAWANSLSVARQSPLLGTIVESLLTSTLASQEGPIDKRPITGSTIGTLIDEFVTYAYGGSFRFARTP